MSNVIANYIWYEKYRPQSCNDLVLEQETHALLRTYINAQDIPHLLFYGRAGSGKTTIAQILCKALPCTYITLNASGEERSIDTMRTTVAQFASSMPSKGKKLKIIFFDEADGITAQAQAALKNTMETYSSSCRFILTANSVNKIIEPIRSRCHEIPLLQFSKEDAIQFCTIILEKEKIQYEVQTVQAIVSRHYPDMRRTMNVLQQASISGKLSLTGATVEADVEAIVRHIRTGAVKSLRNITVNMTDFMGLYVALFNSIEEIFTTSVADAARCLCDHLYYETTIPDREVNFVTMCVEWMVILGVTPNFKK